VVRVNFSSEDSSIKQPQKSSVIITRASKNARNHTPLKLEKTP
jgi:hypothetical protein